MPTKARIIYAAPEVNPGKVARLDALHTVHRAYVQVCVDKMIADRRTNVLPSERRPYFPTSDVLSSQIVKCAQAQAVDLVWTWVQQRYAQKISHHIKRHKDEFDKEFLIQLRCVGKHLLRKPGRFGKGTITQEAVDLAWGWLWVPEIGGRHPKVGPDFPMWMSEMTCVWGPPDEVGHFGWWIRCSTLEKRQTVAIPLVASKYLREGLSKSVLARKRGGRWTFQFAEKMPDVVHDGSAGKVGVDVGLNVIAATSDGRLYGADLKPKFDRLHKQVKDLRANRQRQGFKDDSPRLIALETKLTGLVKTAVGTVANRLVASFPDHTFVLEDLNLRGCKGQKRFAYRLLHKLLVGKAAVEVVQPAYTSQTCPSCGYVSRSNRRGIKFTCRSCGRVAHADVVGGINLLGRSGDKQVGLDDDHKAVGGLLRARFRDRRRSLTSASGRKLPTEKRGNRARTVVPAGSLPEASASGRGRHSPEPGT